MTRKFFRKRSYHLLKIPAGQRVYLSLSSIALPRMLRDKVRIAALHHRISQAEVVRRALREHLK